MKRTIGTAIDIAMVFFILCFLYFHWFYDSNKINRVYFYVNFGMAIAAIVVLPFRVTRYPRISYFFTYKSNGDRRRNFAIPGLAVASVIFLLLFSAKIVISVVESAGR